MPDAIGEHAAASIAPPTPIYCHELQRLPSSRRTWVYRSGPRPIRNRRRRDRRRPRQL